MNCFENNTLGDISRIPIVIGVTGHRDIPDADILHYKEIVSAYFKSLKKQYSCTPFVVMSLLAEGADRLVADVALELQDEGFQIKLIVPLPLPKEEYKKDFETAESKAYFDAVLAREDVISFELPPVQVKGEGSISEHGKLRSRHYLSGGRFIVEHCQILIALWDGVHNGKIGGTSDVVKLQLEGVTGRFDIDESENILSPLTTGPVYHIMTRRTSHTSGVLPDQDQDTEFIKKHLDNGHASHMQLFGINYLFPRDEISRKSLRQEKEKTFKYINDYNKDLIEQNDELKHKISSAVHHLIPEDVYCPTELEVLKKHYACSTSIAGEYKNKVMSLLGFIAYSMPPTVLFFEVYSNMTVSHAFWILYAVLVISAYLYYWFSKRDRNYDKFLDYRALAEGLRVQFYWKQAGINESVVAHYLRKHVNELEWIRYAIRNIELILKMSPEGFGGAKQDTRIQERINSTIKFWIDGLVEIQENAKTKEIKVGQIAFWRERIDQFTTEFESNETRANILFTMTLLIITPALLINHAIHPGGHWDHYFHIIVPVMFVIAGTHKFYNEKMLYKQNIKQYRRMMDTFSYALKRLKTISSSDDSEEEKISDSQKLLVFLGKEALAENADWLLMHREQPIEVPQKG